MTGKINDALKKGLKSLCGQLVSTKTAPENGQDHCYRTGLIPSDLDPRKYATLHEYLARGENPPYLSLTGETCILYNEILRKLLDSPTSEHLEERELDSLLWHFVCDLFVNKNKAEYRDPARHSERIDGFISVVSHSFDDYEVIIPLNHLRLSDIELDVRVPEVKVRTFAGKDLADWGLPRNQMTQAIFGFAGGSFAIVHERGNNPKCVADRARSKLSFAFHVLRTALSTKSSPADEELLFESSEHIAIKKRGGEAAFYVEWKSKRTPIPIILGEDAGKTASDFSSRLQSILQDGKIEEGLKKRIRRAVSWFGRATEEEDLDTKLVFLSTAMETLLTTKSDKNKGENIAFRSLLLSRLLQRPGIHPSVILWGYEIRSLVVHGSDLEITSEQHYEILRAMTIQAIDGILTLLSRRQIRKHRELIDSLEQSPKRKAVKKWLQQQKDRLSKQLILRLRPESPLLRFLTQAHWYPSKQLIPRPEGVGPVVPC